MHYASTSTTLWAAATVVAVFAIVANNSSNYTHLSASAFQSHHRPSPAAALGIIRARLQHHVSRNAAARQQRVTIVACRAIKVTIRIVGRAGEEWLEQACAMYEKRLGPNNIEINTIWHKTNDALCKAVVFNNDNENKKMNNANNVPITVLLDPEFGKSCTSNQFAEQFYQWAQDGGSRLVFVIGGADGLPNELRRSSSSNNKNNNNTNNNNKHIFLSLSDLTFTHQFARLLLTEQIYRASEIVSFLCVCVQNVLLLLVDAFAPTCCSK